MDELLADRLASAGAGEFRSHSAAPVNSRTSPSAHKIPGYRGGPRTVLVNWS